MDYKQFYVLLLQYLLHRQNEADNEFNIKMDKVIRSLQDRPVKYLYADELQDLLVAKVVLDTKLKIYNDINLIMRLCDTTDLL